MLLALAQTVAISAKFNKRTYRISPDGERFYIDNSSLKLYRLENEERFKDCKLVGTVVYFIYIKLGKDGKKMALLDKTCCNIQEGVIRRTYTMHKYEGSVEDLLSRPTDFAANEELEKIMREEFDKSYDEEMPITVYRHEEEYDNGYRVIRQTKVKTIVNATVNVIQ